MKRKSIFLFLSVFVLSLCTTLGLVKLQDEEVYAESLTASVWDGEQNPDVFGSDYYTDGSQVHILTADGFVYFANMVNSGNTYTSQTVSLETDIDLASHEWTPIGTEINSFSGTFDGNGHTIFNLKITNSSTDVGLFGYTTGVVNNLILEDVDINVSGATNVGGLIGCTTYSSKTLSKISVSGDITVADGTNVGGVVGCSQGLSLRNASTILSRVDIITSSMLSNSAVGGIFGSFSVGVGTLEQLGFNGTIKSGASYIGGLFGKLESFLTLKNSYSDHNYVRTTDGNLTSYFGGIAGGVVTMSERTSQVYNIYTAGNLKDIFVGEGMYVNKDGYNSARFFGNMGKNQNGTIKITNALSLNNAGVIETYKNEDYPLYFNPNNVEVDISYTWFEAEKLANLDDKCAVLELGNMARQKGFYSNEIYFDQGNEYKWDFENIWYLSNEFVDNEDFWHPRLISHKFIGNSNNDQDYSYSDGLDGDGSLADPYRIRTAGDLGYLSVNYSGEYQGKWFSLESDIDLTGKTWQPLGANPSVPFSGVFLGNGHTISGITCSLQYQFSYHGFFGVTKDAFIRDLTIGKIRFINGGDGEQANGTRGFMGSFVGYAQANTYLDNCETPILTTVSMSLGLKI